jgi:NADH-quinone oxidoreductase subunit J
MARLVFLGLALVAVASAVGLVVRRNAIHGALLLVVNLGTVAALYLLMGFEFLAFAQLIVYAGAIMVLFVFAIMVLIPGKDEVGPDPRRRWRVLAAPLGGILLAEMGLAVGVRGIGAGPPARPVPGSAEALGRVLFTDYLLPFELASVLLLAAMVGVLLLARRRA